MPLFDGKVVIVTGGGSGIGQAACHLYAHEGAKVVVSDIDETGGNETVTRIHERNEEPIFVRADVSKPEDYQAMANAASKQMDGCISFNSAGIGGEPALTGAYYPIDGGYLAR